MTRVLEGCTVLGPESVCIRRGLTNILVSSRGLGSVKCCMTVWRNENRHTGMFEEILKDKGHNR